MPSVARLVPALAFCLFLTPLIVCDGQPAPYFMAAVHPSQLHALSSSFVADLSSPSPSPSVSPPARLPLAGVSRPIVFIPTFQDTLLHHCTSRVCRPLHLAPLNPRSFARCYAALQSAETMLLPHQPHIVEHPTVTCPPSPFSHQTHCNPIPGVGPVQKLRNALSASSSTRVPPAFHALPYDWRHRFQHVLRPDGHFAALLKEFVAPPASSPVVIAHATACHLIHAALHSFPSLRPALLICLAPPSPRAATASLVRGHGLLTAGGLHTYYHPASAAPQGPARVSYSAVAHELGLSNSRRPAFSFPNDGPWQSMSQSPVASAATLTRIASSIPALRDLATAIPPAAGSTFRVVCVEALLEHSDYGGPSACSQLASASTVRANATAYNLVSLLAAVGDDLLTGLG